MASGRGDAAGERRRRSTAMARDERGRFVRAAKPGEEPEGRDGRRATKAAAGSTGSEGPSEGATKAMATPVKMPELGESFTEGTITRWLKQEGDRVEADEPLFEISTDKVDTEVPSPVSGVLTSIKVHEDETVAVGAELAEIEQDGQEGGAQPAAGEAEQAEAEPAQEEAAQEPAEPEPAQAAEEAAPREQREAVAEAEPPAAATAGAEQAPPPAGAEGGDGGVTTVTMPGLGESITEGTITRWLKQEGDRVEADEPLFENSTDKVDTEVPSPVSGVLTSIKVHEDETVAVGAELAEIGGQGGGGAPAQQPAKAEERAPAPAEQRAAA